jgi:hypothetical protein
VIGSLSGRIFIVATFAVASVGALDAARGGIDDLIAVFVIVAALQAMLFFVLRLGRRRQVAVRSDLAEWLEERSAITGETVERIADRCIAQYRADMRRKT